MKIIVRFVHDHKEDRCWFEEKVPGGWSVIPETKMACEGNSRSRLADVIEQRRLARLAIMQSVGNEEAFEI